MKTSKIKTIDFTKEWTSKAGNVIFYHNIEFENGDKGNIGAMSKLPDKLSIGSELNYDIEETSTGNKIKVLQSKSRTGYSQEPFEHKAAGMTMGYVKDLIIADKIKIDSLESAFNRIYSIIISKKI